MGQEISASRRFGMENPRFEAWVDRGWLLGLFVAAVVLLGINLGDLPLRDWDEGIVAQVAREMWRSPFPSSTWLYPKELTGTPYFNKPPLMHWLVALTYSIAGVSELTTRLPGAMLTAFSVPMMYWLGREVFFQRTAAIFSALVYLTWLPVARQGRLAMLDGAVLCFFLLMMACLLRSRRDLRWGLGVGIGVGLICLTKGILGLLLGAIGLLFLIWDTPRLLTSRYLWLGIAIGAVPIGLWYGAQWSHYHQQFIDAHLLNQSLVRVWGTVGNNNGPVWYYLWEILKFGFPWLLFLPQGLRLAWENRGLSWARLALVWSGVYLLVISAMQTKLPWYALPIYPALSLMVGAQLSRMWNPLKMGIRQQRPIVHARIWFAVFAVFAFVAWGLSAYFTFFAPQQDLQLVSSTLALTVTVTAILILRQDTQFISVLIWGTYLTLMVLMMSSHWVWELAESYPVKPVADMIQRYTPRGQTIYTSYPYHRPSLNFYSDRAVVPASEAELQQRWKTDPHPYQLLRSSALGYLPTKQTQLLEMQEGWILVTRNSHFKPMVSASRHKSRKS
ncbi:glycosyltransferase family 39 protein [Phormidesmis priestleyi ULC007]|uniref:Glycosyltransferase family 39 protein n=1 Tax=Phormidesmis priestleyi ULC007 TaxID=1920490 RepID=A0A2T1DIC2_9CYAN|nr:glycosyltransferase family 39 protein [Phormidesmis priestleyi]PSB20181.1 glycosyltransferase family 39 protein [Phormidesmis priestleyi ULC007]